MNKHGHHARRRPGRLPATIATAAVAAVGGTSIAMVYAASPAAATGRASVSASVHALAGPAQTQGTTPATAPLRAAKAAASRPLAHPHVGTLQQREAAAAEQKAVAEAAAKKAAAKAAAKKAAAERQVRAERAAAARRALAVERAREAAAQRVSRDAARPAAGSVNRVAPQSTARHTVRRTTTSVTVKPAVAPVSTARSAGVSGGAVGIAERYIGTPYVWGGASPAGFDCSGFTQYVFGRLGISLPHSASAQQAMVSSAGGLRPGDLVFFGSPAYHVGIYVGNGMMIDETHPGSSVTLQKMWTTPTSYGRP